MNSEDKPATRGDVEEIVTKATSEILTAVGEQIGVVNDRIDTLATKVDERFDRLERKVDNVTDDHETRITKLEKQQI